VAIPGPGIASTVPGTSFADTPIPEPGSYLPLIGTFIVSALPAAAAGNKGQLAYVSDATLPAYAAPVVGGGGVFILVLSDGSHWNCA
jgi:hypothetical protein